MADIDQIIAGGAGASSRANFDGFSGIADAFFKAREEKAKNDLRTAFKDGVPTDANGQPDFSAMAKTLFQKGGLNEGVSAANLGIQQQNIQQNQEGARYAATGQGQPVDIPSSNRNAAAVVAKPLNRGGVNNTGSTPQQGGATIMQVLTAQGIPNDQLGAAGASVARQLGVDDPNAPVDLSNHQVRNVIIPAIQRLKQAGIGQVVPNGPPQGQSPQAAPQAPQQPAPMVPTPVATQRIQPQAAPAPSPFANAVAAGLIPQGVDPVRFVAGLKYRAAALPKGPAQEMIQSQVNAIDKATELTQGQRDYNASRASPGLDEYAAQKEADVASAKGVAEANVKEQNDLIGAGKQASQRLATLNTLSNIVNSDKGLTLGFGADTALKVKMAMKQFGIDVGDLSGAEAIQKLNASLASEAAKSISARPAQFEFKTFLSNNPGLSLDKQGNQRVIGIFSQLAKRDVDLGRLARANRDNWDNWDNVVQQYDKQNPIHDPASGKVITTDSIVAPGPAKGEPQNKAPTLEPGKTVINGHTYKGGNPNLKSSWELRT
jgi:hypothetical protein